MKWQKYSPIPSSVKVKESEGNPRRRREQIFAGIWIRWSALTQAERVVCTCIVCIPLWWLWGWSYLTLILMLSIFAYQILRQGSLQLQKPSLFVIAGIAVGLYELLSIYFWGVYNDNPLTYRAITNSTITWIAPNALLLYIKNYNLRVRLQIVAWAFSVVIVQMLIYWFIIYFVWKQTSYLPSRSLFGLLSAKNEVFVPGLGNSNYLIPYLPTDSSLPGMARYVFFFHGPESLALVVGFICLLALDVKQRVWSLLMFSSSFFLLLLSGTRSTWVVMPVILILRWLIKNSKDGKLWLICALIAIFSFVTLSIAPVNDLISGTATHTAKATGDLRGDSTEVRAEIYRQTWEGFLNGSDSQIIFGHVVPGETVLPGYEPAQVGSHSFLLSTLLYRWGLLGTGIFLSYWSSLIWWLYETRTNRPLSSLLVYLLFSFTFSVMEFESVVMPLILVTAVLYQSSEKIPNKSRYQKKIAIN